MCRKMAAGATFFGLFHKLIQILIAWLTIYSLAFHRAIGLTISFTPIQLGAMKTLFVINPCRAMLDIIAQATRI